MQHWSNYAQGTCNEMENETISLGNITECNYTLPSLEIRWQTTHKKKTELLLCLQNKKTPFKRVAAFKEELFCKAQILFTWQIFTLSSHLIGCSSLDWSVCPQPEIAEAQINSCVGNVTQEFLFMLYVFFFFVCLFLFGVKSLQIKQDN